MTVLEIAVQDPAGIAAAARGGADRIELCTGLALGGLTPSSALIARAVAGDLPVHVLVRPRAGGFDYSSEEQAVILDDIAAALSAGAAGVVVGATRGGSVDAALVRTARDLAGSATLTFHRAFDTLDDRRAAVEELADLGVDRVLTSGGSDRAPDALAELARIVAWSAGRLEITAGGGIDKDSVGAVARTGVPAVHSSAKRLVADSVTVGLGSAAPAGSPRREVTDEAEVRALRAVLDARSVVR